MNSVMGAAKQALATTVALDAWTADARLLPPHSGAYLLLMSLRQAAPVANRFDGFTLPAGTYIYAGSAKGPGGIRGRCARHFRQPKKRHWHVDWLTDHAVGLHAAAIFDRDECDLIEHLLTVDGVHIPLQGFGSSDCKTCAAHLVRLG